MPSRRLAAALGWVLSSSRASAVSWASASAGPPGVEDVDHRLVQRPGVATTDVVDGVADRSIRETSERGCGS